MEAATAVVKVDAREGDGGGGEGGGGEGGREVRLRHVLEVLIHEADVVLVPRLGLARQDRHGVPGVGRQRREDGRGVATADDGDMHAAFGVWTMPRCGPGEVYLQCTILLLGFTTRDKIRDKTRRYTTRDATPSAMPGPLTKGTVCGDD